LVPISGFIIGAGPYLVKPLQLPRRLHSTALVSVVASRIIASRAARQTLTTAKNPIADVVALGGQAYRRLQREGTALRTAA